MVSVVPGHPVETSPWIETFQRIEAWIDTGAPGKHDANWHDRDEVFQHVPLRAFEHVPLSVMSV